MLPRPHAIEHLRQASAPGSNAAKRKSAKRKGRKKKHDRGEQPPRPVSVGLYQVREAATEHSGHSCSSNAPKWEAKLEDLCQGRRVAECDESNCSRTAPKWEAAFEDLCQGKVLEDDRKRRRVAECGESNCSRTAPKWEAKLEDLCQGTEDDRKRRRVAERSESNCNRIAPKWEAKLEDLCQGKVLEDDRKTEVGTGHLTSTKHISRMSTYRRCTKTSCEVGPVSDCPECVSRARR